MYKIIKAFRKFARKIFQLITGVNLTELEHLHRRFRTRVYLSSDTFLPMPSINKSSYGYQNKHTKASYRDFEDIFRGDEDFIKNRLKSYVGFFHIGNYILEIGCGRGEFLELLAEMNIRYIGVDFDNAMLDRCREKDLSPVICEDFEFFLNKTTEETFDGIFSAQFIEHIPSDKIACFFNLCFSALKPNGILIVETVNPYCIEAFRTFHVDLTHQKILYPEVLLYYCMATGFRNASIYYPLNGGFSESEYDIATEYAVIAYK